MKKHYITTCAALCCLGLSTQATAKPVNTELLFSTELMSASDSLQALTGNQQPMIASWEVATANPAMLTMTETAPMVQSDEATHQGGEASAPVSDTAETAPIAENMEVPSATADHTEIAAPAIQTPVLEEVPVAPPTPQLSSQELFAAANTSLSQGNRSKALDHLAQLLSADPGHRVARLMYGKQLVLNRQYTEASLVLPELLNNSSDWRAWYWMGTASLMRGQLKEAENYLSEGIARNGEIAELWVQRAIIEQESNNHQTALQLLTIAKDLDPSMPEVSLNIAYSADAIGNKELANRAYGQFLIQTNKSPKHIRVRQKVISLF